MFFFLCVIFDYLKPLQIFKQGQLMPIKDTRSLCSVDFLSRVTVTCTKIQNPRMIKFSLLLFQTNLKYSFFCFLLLLLSLLLVFYFFWCFFLISLCIFKNFRFMVLRYKFILNRGTRYSLNHFSSLSSLHLYLHLQMLSQVRN